MKPGIVVLTYTLKVIRRLSVYINPNLHKAQICFSKKKVSSYKLTKYDTKRNSL